MRLPSKDSATWRGLVTAAETALAFLAGLLAIPEVARYITEYHAQWLFLPPAIAFAASFVRNHFRKDVKNY